MKIRAITSFFFVLIMLAAVLTGPYTFSAFFVLLGLLCTDEFYRMVRSEAIQPNRLLGLLLGIVLFTAIVLCVLTDAGLIYLYAGVPLISLIFFTTLYRNRKDPFSDIAFTFLGLIYGMLPFVFFYALGFINGVYEYSYPLGFMLMLWASDTGAYLTGRSLGRHKLFERHSPKKTWEGFAGGLLLSVVAACLLAHYFNGPALWQWIGSAVMIAVFGTFGDLTESMLKRSLDVKDSGAILPGHGGLLDRFDGLLLAAPLVYIFLKLTL